MTALLFLPLLLIFTLVDFGGGGDEAEAETDAPTGDLNANGDIDVASLLDIVDLSEGDDAFTGSAELDQVNGLGGDDRLIGLGATDFLDGGAGDDVVRGGAGGDVLGGGEGTDKVVGGNGDDILLGGDGNDLLVGQNGDDLLYGGAGEDDLYGGDGDDILYSFLNDGPDPRADEDEAPGWTVEYLNAYDALIFARPDLTSQEADDILSAQGFGEEDQPVSASDGQADYLEGGGGNDILFLGSGDEGFGGTGNDSFVVTTGNSDADEALVSDFDQEDDVVIVHYPGPAIPEITVEAAGADAEVRADGRLLALVRDAAGALDSDDIRLVRSS